MSQRYVGGVITANPTTPTLTSASGVWTQEQYLQYIQPLQSPIIGRSVRFRSAALPFFSRTFGAPTSNQKFTISTWVKLTAFDTYQYLTGAGTGSGDFTAIYFNNASNQIGFRVQSGSVDKIVAVTTAVFRDPSAWYHVVISIDTTQATSALGFIVYVNGVQQSVTSTFWTQNQATNFTTGTAAQLGYASSLASNGAPYLVYLDSYFAKTYFIDGQSLTANSFGSYDSNGIWQPATYAGTYGNNGYYLSYDIGTASTYAGSFDGSAKYLSIAYSSLFAQQSATNWTIEAWVNSSSATLQELFHFGNATVTTGNDVGWGMSYTPGSTFNFFQYNGTTNTGFSSSLNVPSGQWAHIAVVNNGGTVTGYLNGTACGTCTAVNTNNLGTFNFYIGNYGNARYINGQVSNFRLVKGTAVYTANFTPPISPLTAITNTALLTCQNATFVDNSTNAFTITNTGGVTTTTATPFGAIIGCDASGKGNNWTANNINYSTAGVTYDSMIDSPTNFDDGGNGTGNYPTWNPLSGINTVLSNANLGASFSAASYFTRATMAIPSTGKWYMEFTAANSLYHICGIAIGKTSNNSNLGDGTGELGYWWNGSCHKEGVTQSGTWATTTTNDVIGMAVDSGAGTVTFYKNNVVTGSTVSYSFGSEVFPAFGTYLGGGSVYMNFGQLPFNYTPPTGFKALNTQNLALAAPPTITNGAQYMAATLWSGTSAVQSISNGTNNTIGTTFQPDFAWIKGRNNATDHQLVDSVRGTSSYLSSNLTAVQATNTTAVTAFASGGLTLGNNSNTSQRVNYSGDTYVGWQWKAGGTVVSNTAGSITSSVSAGATQGFSVVTYTGTGANATVGHGLGVAPSMIIIKNRTSAYSWAVWFTGFSTTEYMSLNTTGAKSTFAGQWNTLPTSSVFGLGSTDLASNQSGATFVAYCFAAVPGYSAFGTYTGNGSATGNGPFVYCGFRPRFILLKNISTAATAWYIFDTSRDTYNVAQDMLYPNAATAETVSNPNQVIDVLSNGFKIRSTSSGWDNNNSGNTIIFAAFAENPFTIARAR